MGRFTAYRVLGHYTAKVGEEIGGPVGSGRE